MTENKISKTGWIAVLIFIFGLFAQFGSGSNEEENVLLEAEKLYHEGYFPELLDMLKDFIKKNESNKEKIKYVNRAYYLVARTHWIVGEDTLAEEWLAKLFTSDLSFQQKEENLEFQKFFEKFRRKFADGEYPSRPYETKKKDKQ